jgi:heme exporter protein A
LHSSTTLTATALTCIKGERLLFRDLSISLQAGEGLELSGPNGVGKTSLLRILAGLTRPEAGSVVIAGLDEDDSGGAIEFLTSRDGLKSALTALEHLHFWARFGGHDHAGQALPGLLETVGLGAQAELPAGALSSGQRRRLVLARAMLAKRPILLMDEPLNALDEDGQSLLRAFLETRLNEGAIAIIATHQSLGLPGLRPFPLGGRSAE